LTDGAFEDASKMDPLMRQQRSMVSPLVVGRDDVLAIADSFIGEAKAGRGNLLMFAGEPGIGKTRIVYSTIRKATAQGFRYAKGDVNPQDSLVSLASVYDLARSMTTDDFGSLGSDLLSIEGIRDGDNLARRRVLVRDIADRIISSISVPTLLAFADLQWADELALEVVGELARLGRDRPLLLLADYRLDELPAGSIHREWRSRLLTQRVAEEVTLKRLTREQTALVTTLILGTGLPAPREVVDAVYERTNGIPLHIEELLGALGDLARLDGQAIRRAAVPDTIEDAILARSSRLSREAQVVARAGAVMGRCFAPSAIAGLVDRATADLEEPLDELVQQGFLHPFEFVDEGYFDFRHQLLRDALYQSVPTAELRRLHARAAEFGTKLVGASEVHASLHFERAGMRDEAFQSALAGARAAANVTSRYEAFELYRRAAANIPASLSARERGEVYMAYASSAGDVDDCQVIDEAARQARAAFLEADMPLEAVHSLLFLYHVARRDAAPREERERILMDVERELAAVPASPERTSLMGEVAYHQVVLAMDRMDLDAARRRIKELGAYLSPGGIEADDVAGLEAQVDALDGRVKSGLGRMLDVARRARDARMESAGVTTYRVAAWLAIRFIDYPTAETGIREGLRYADEIEQSYCRHVIAASSATLAWAAGRWDEAVEIGGVEMLERGSRRATIGSRHAVAYVALGRGELERARSLLDEALAVALPTQEVELTLPGLWGLAETDLAAGQPKRAFERCLEAVDLAEPTAERALLVPFVVTGVRAAIADRRPEAAEPWLERMRVLLQGWDELARPALDHAEGLVRLYAGATVAAKSLLESAVRGWDARGRIWEATLARLDLATCLVRGNRPREALPLVAEVRITARQLASPPLLARADELERSARSHGGELEAWHPLTIREYEVARQIASGMTNNEIAGVLSLSPKTVSAHVEHILAKLDVARRAEIATWVATVARPEAAAAPGRQGEPLATVRLRP
jgi:DNA-binding CsgD family transcriptional regulator